jgi:ATP-dependent protease HslVU (ClpYQ) peptidase subunit
MKIEDLTQNELLINTAGVSYFYRDLLEALAPITKRKTKQLVNRLIIELNKDIKEIADNPEVWQELEQLVNHFHDNMVIEQK